MEEIRRYELYLVFRPELDENGLEGLIERVDTTLTSNEGEIVEIVRRGKRRLQYPIESFTSGIDVDYQANLPTSLLALLERQFNLSEDVLRYLIVRRDDLQKEERLVQSEAEIEATVAELTAETSQSEAAAEAAARGEVYEASDAVPVDATESPDSGEGSDSDDEQITEQSSADEPEVLDPTEAEEVPTEESDSDDEQISEQSSADEPEVQYPDGEEDDPADNGSDDGEES